MAQDDLLKRLETLSKPEFTSQTHQTHLRLALLNARRSSRLGYVLVAVPCLFLLGILLKYWWGVNLGMFDWLENYLASLDRTSYTNWLVPTILLAGPIIGLGMNLLTLLHVTYDRREAMVVIRLKVRWANLIVAGLCLTVAVLFLGYLMAEYYAHLESLFFRMHNYAVQKRKL